MQQSTGHATLCIDWDVASPMDSGRIVPQAIPLPSLRGRELNLKNIFIGCGPALHEDPRNQPVSRYGGVTRFHLGADAENFVRLPIIPDA